MGNPHVYWCRLNEDMVSVDGDIHRIDYPIDTYQEGPWFYKHDGKYYLAFASTCCPEGIGYAMSDSPVGPWKSMGAIMDRTWRTRGNHPGIIEFKGQSYVFGLNYDLMHLKTFKHAEQRSVSVAPMYYEPDGSIRKVPYWLDNIVEQVGTFDPFRKVEAETMAWGYGLKTDVVEYPRHSGLAPESHGIVLRDIDAGEYLLVKGVDFGKGAGKFLASVEGAATIEVRLDAVDGPLVGTLVAKPGKPGFRESQCRLRGATGVHDVYFVFKEGGFRWDWWKMAR